MKPDMIWNKSWESVRRLPIGDYASAEVSKTNGKWSARICDVALEHDFATDVAAMEAVDRRVAPMLANQVAAS